MGRKKKKEKESKPWCWYCNREFETTNILLQHQKTKHFKCSFCPKKLVTGPGLSIHCSQMHKEVVLKVPNSLPSRSDIAIAIYGMDGIPPEDLEEYENQKRKKHGRAASPSDGKDEPPSKKKSNGEIRPPLPPDEPPDFPPIAPIAPWIMTPVGPMPPPVHSGIGMIQSANHLQGKPPLFPSAAAIASAAGSSSATTTPTSSSSNPANSNGDRADSNSVSADQNVGLFINLGSSSRVMHPTEDISIEEWKAKQPKYQLISEAAKPVEDPVEEPAPVTSPPAALQTPKPPAPIPVITGQHKRRVSHPQKPSSPQPEERMAAEAAAAFSAGTMMEMSGMTGPRFGGICERAPWDMPPHMSGYISGHHPEPMGPHSMPFIPARMPLSMHVMHQRPIRPELVRGMMRPPPPGMMFNNMPGFPVGCSVPINNMPRFPAGYPGPINNMPRFPVAYPGPPRRFPPPPYSR